MYETNGRRALQIVDPRHRGGLGFIDPVTAVNAAVAFFQAFNPAQWFGAGRREADAIGPTQDKVNEAIASIAQSVGIPNWTLANQWRIPDTTSYAALVEGDRFLRELRTNYLSFLRNTENFPDGRASGQSASAVMPQLDGTGNYGLHASGGTPTTTPGFSWITGPIPPGGLLGEINRAASARSSAPAPTTTAPVVTEPAPTTPAAPGGSIFPIGTILAPDTALETEPTPWYALPGAASQGASYDYGVPGPVSQAGMIAPPGGAAAAIAGAGESYLPWVLIAGVVAVALYSRSK